MTKIAINGFGRIGRCVARAILANPSSDLEIVGINDIASLKELRDAVPLRRELQFMLTRVSREELPSKWTEEDLVDWLDTQWVAIDHWVTINEQQQSP